MPYNGYFMSSSSLTLIYDFMHDPGSAPAHLRWVYDALQNLSTMKGHNASESTITAIQTILRNIDPSYEWSPYPNVVNDPQDPTNSSQVLPNQEFGQSGPGLSFPTNYRLAPQSNPQTSQWSYAAHGGPETGRSGGSTDDLTDFTQSEMGWDFDFSTMDLEAFFSVYPTANPGLPFGNSNG